jgi:hypothetical protein
MIRMSVVERNEYIARHGKVPQNRADIYLGLAKEGHVFSEGEIIRGMRGLFNEHSRKGLFRRGPSYDDTLGDSLNELNEYLCEHPRPISPDHNHKGIDWWRAQCFKKNGAWRETKFTQQLHDHRRCVVQAFDHFLFCGFAEEMGNPSGLLYVWLPIYSMVSHTGTSFDYSYGAWQSGTAGLRFDT